MVEDRIESEEAITARVQINRSLNKCHSVVVLAGISTVITYTPPPAVGGYVQKLDIIINMFSLHNYQIPPSTLFDNLDRAIGVYEGDETSSVIRTFNPFYWFGLFLDLIVEIPFSFLSKSGFNSKAIRGSVFGKITTALIYMVTALASFLTILQLTGFLDSFNAFFKSIFFNSR